MNSVKPWSYHRVPSCLPWNPVYIPVCTISSTKMKKLWNPLHNGRVNIVNLKNGTTHLKLSVDNSFQTFSYKGNKDYVPKTPQNISLIFRYKIKMSVYQLLYDTSQLYPLNYLTNFQIHAPKPPLSTILMCANVCQNSEDQSHGKRPIYNVSFTLIMVNYFNDNETESRCSAQAPKLNMQISGWTCINGSEFRKV